MKTAGFAFFCSLFLCVAAAEARDAAFVTPSSAASARNSVTASADAVTVEPKGDVDVGDSSLGISRRVALFFVNQTDTPIDVENMSLTTDSNIAGTIVSDDCSKNGKLTPSNRCVVVLSFTPNSGGSWSAELLLTYNGPGRVARARITGKASTGPGGGDRKDMGLSLNAKDLPPVNFADVEVGGNRAVRSALIVNDSVDPITLLSIDLIAAENGLSRMDQGCAIDMELKPGESCPITLAWQPTTRGTVFTDLIVRHSGQTGFMVVPVRGAAKEAVAGSVAGGNSVSGGGSISGAKDKGGNKIPLPPTAEDLERAVAGKLPSLSASAIEKDAKREAVSEGRFHLIGTIGARAILLKPDGGTVTTSVGEDIRYDDGKIAKLTSLTPQKAEIFVGGKRVELDLEAASDLTSKAVVEHHDGGRKDSKDSKDSRDLGGRK